MDLPSTGWVTVLAGLLARGPLPRCFRPSQFPSGRIDAGPPLPVAGAAPALTDSALRARRVPALPPFLPPPLSDLSLSEPVSGRVGLWSKADSYVYFTDYSATPAN